MRDEIKTWLDRRHPAYATHADHWAFLLETYEGGPEWFNSRNLPRYPAELKAKYNHRLANSTRDNLTADVVNIHAGYLFKTRPTREGDDRMMAFWDNAKRASGNIDDLMIDASNQSAVTGRVAIMVDKPNVTALSRAGDATPYAYLVSVLDLLDYAKDTDDRLLWTLVREYERDDADPIASSGEVKDRYRLLTREGWGVYAKSKNQVVLLESGEWGFAVPTVPMVILDHQDGCSPYAPPGLVDEIALLDRLIAQEESSLHEVVEAQGAPTLMFPGMSDDPLSLGISSVLTYDPASVTQPSYLTVPGEFITALQSRIEQLKTRIREKAALPSRQGSDQSGESKRWDHAELHAILSSKAQNLQAAEAEIARIVDLFNGGNGEHGAQIRYPSSFDVTTLDDDTNRALILNELVGQSSPTYRVQLAQSLAKKSLPDLAPDIQAAINAEIEANITDGDATPDEGE